MPAALVLSPWRVIRLLGPYMAKAIVCAMFAVITCNFNVHAAEWSVADVADVAERARTQGDAASGALVFYSAQLGCARCHDSQNGEANAIGPDLSRYAAEDRPTDQQLVEAILEPSKRIRRGYESHSLLTQDGRTLSGRLVSQQAGMVKLQDASGQLFTIPDDEIEALNANALSSMPAGLADQMGSEQQLVNVVRFLIELRDQGPERLAQLRPAQSAANQVAAYETSIDHAALIKDSHPEVLKQGEAIYQRVCANCHGTIQEPGSLPTSLRFAEGKFKNGSDPYSMYRTLTYGYGMMTPQHWMVPRQKYAVIHYIRDKYLKTRNPSQWSEISETYLASVPTGDSLGPEPSEIDAWNSMDYGQALTHTYQISAEPFNIAYKGIAIRLDPGVGGVARGSYWTVFDTDTLRWAAGWQWEEGTSRFINWRGIQFNGEHNIHPSIDGKLVFANSNGPGWAQPESESFEDRERVLGRDQRRYGPLPKSWGRYLGQYRLGESVIVAYRIGETTVHELPSLAPAREQEHGAVWERTLWIGPRTQDLFLQVAERSSTTPPLRCGVLGNQEQLQWQADENRVVLKIKAGEAIQFKLGIAEELRAESQNNDAVQFDLPISDLAFAGQPTPWLQGSPAAWNTPLRTVTNTIGNPTEPFLVDHLTLPDNNPWSAQIRCTGLDFFSDGSFAVCMWDGDVWKVNVDQASTDNDRNSALSWRRIATGMFQPLGLKIVDDQIYVSCRDQITKLHDLNQDGEIDFYQCFNNDHQVTEHFHEFAMGLQRDTAGNFYYAKSARHALKAVVPHHGTLLKVSPDGEQTEVIANGFRAANGVCLNPDGTFYVTDQEGHWNPKNRINWVRPSANGQPLFYGNLFGYHSVTDPSDQAMEPPLCWITNQFDRSPGELLWVDSKRWGTLNGALLELSYGMGRVYLVLPETIDNRLQGGMIALPIPDFPTGVMRGRFHPADGQLYLCGMFAWAGNAQQSGGLYRLRRTSEPLRLPAQLHVSRSGVKLAFLAPLNAQTVRPENVSIKVWSLKRTANYGSEHLNERSLQVTAATLETDDHTVALTVPEIGPTWCMEIEYRFEDATGHEVQGTIHNTIHALGD